MLTSEDQSQLRALVIGHYVVGGLTALFSLMTIFHITLGVMIITGKLDEGHGGPPVVFGWFFVIIAVIFMLLGFSLAGCIFYSARAIKRFEKRMFSFVTGCVMCIFFPFGTLLGIFTIILLSRESIKQAYLPTAPSDSDDLKPATR